MNFWENEWNDESPGTSFPVGRRESQAHILGEGPTSRHAPVAGGLDSQGTRDTDRQRRRKWGPGEASSEPGKKEGASLRKEEMVTSFNGCRDQSKWEQRQGPWIWSCKGYQLTNDHCQHRMKDRLGGRREQGEARSVHRGPWDLSDCGPQYGPLGYCANFNLVS